MEDRYRMMSSVGVRSLASFNDKVRSAARPRASRSAASVQTGYDAETGQPIYEEESSIISRCRRSWSSSTSSPT